MKSTPKINKIFLSIFLPILIIEIVLVLGFTTYIYSDIYKSMEDSLLIGKKNYITWVKNGLDQQIQTIERTFSAYSMTDTFEYDMNKPFDYKDYMHIRSVINGLNSISLMGSEQVDYSLISIPYHWKVNSNTFTELTEDIMYELNDSLDTRTNTVFWESTASGIRMMMRLPVLSEQKYAVGIAEIGQRNLQKLTQSFENNLLLIFNKDQELLYSKQKNQISNDNINKILSNKDEELLLSNGDRALITYSVNSQWIFVTILRNLEVIEKVSNVRIGLFLISIVLLLVLGCISFILARRFIQPFKIISNKLSINKVEGYTVNSIVNRIDNLVNEQHELSIVLENQKNQLETLFIWDLFRNRLSESEIQQNLNKFTYDWSVRKVFYVLLIQSELNTDETEKSVQLFALQNVIIEVIDFNIRMQPILYTSDTVALIIVLDKEINFEEREKLLKELCQKIDKCLQQLKIITYFGVSNEYEHLSETSRSCQWAKEALRYQHYYNEDLFFYKKEMAHKSTQQISKYPIAIENHLFENIRKGDRELVSELYECLFTEIIKKNLTPLNLRVAVTTLLNHLLNFNQLMRLNTSFSQNSQKYDELLAIENIDKLKERKIL